MSTSGTIESRASFSGIRYANCWEDPALLIKALGTDLQNTKNCLSIASAGDNSLALLLCNPAVVLAADLSHAQIACTELRMVAIGKLDYTDLLAFLGVKPSSTRGAVYRVLRSDLTLATREFWDGMAADVERGIIFAGKFERYFRLFREQVLPLIHSKRRVRELLIGKTAEQRTEYYNGTWNGWRWKLLFRIFFSRFVMGRAGRDPEFFRYVDGSVAERILERTRHALVDLDPSENPYVDFILTGNYTHTLPLYLHEPNLAVIRTRLDRLVLHHGSTDDAMQRHNLRFDAYNLSDIFEYMSPDAFAACATRLVASANPGARLAYWNLLAHRSVAAILPERVKAHAAFARTLHAADQAFFYGAFHADEVVV